MGRFTGILGILAVLLAAYLGSTDRKHIRWRTIAWGTAAAALLYLPWAWYQKRYDPPGDLLLKAHIAGIVDQTRSFGQLLRSAYGRLSFGEWVYNKLENIRVLFVPDDFALLFVGNPRQRFDLFTAGNFYATFQALGLLNFGLLLRWKNWRINRKAAG